eukprot:1326803-Ditylum_brightwellii.AAC.1
MHHWEEFQDQGAMVFVEQRVLGAHEAALLAEEKWLGGARWVRQWGMLVETDLPVVKRMVPARLVVLWAGMGLWQIQRVIGGTEGQSFVGVCRGAGGNTSIRVVLCQGAGGRTGRVFGELTWNGERRARRGGLWDGASWIMAAELNFWHIMENCAAMK